MAPASAMHRRRTALLLTAAILGVCGTAARAQEQLVIPYICSAAGGRVTLTPSREESYRIYGAREQRQFTACSPVNPSLCRTWLVHRFDLDCGGARVPWLAVIAAASERMTGRAWVEDGRLLLRMGPFWGMGPDGQQGPIGRWRRRYEDRLPESAPAYRPRAVVEMPPGFAPALGMPVRFAPAEPPPIANADITRAAPLPSRPPAPAHAPEVAAPPVQPKPTLPKTPATREAAVKEPPAVALPAPSAAPGTSQAPRIINRPGTEPAPQAATEPAAPPPSAPPRQAAAPPAPAAVPPVQVAHEAPPPQAVPITEAAKSAEPASAPATPRALSATPSSATSTQALVGFAGLVTLMLALFAWTRHRERLRLAAVGAREFGSVNFEGAHAPRGRNRALSAPAAVPPSAPAGPPQGAGPPFEFRAPAGWLPATRAEALQLIGASPQASLAAIKKIIDGLRQSWHPDHAGDDADRQLREQRTKQVNVAWDIISGKRPSA